MGIHRGRAQADPGRLVRRGPRAAFIPAELPFTEGDQGFDRQSLTNLTTMGGGGFDILSALLKTGANAQTFEPADSHA